MMQLRGKDTMYSDPDDAEPDYTNLIEHLNTLGMRVGEAYADWLEFAIDPLPPHVETKVEDLQRQLDKVVADVHLFIKYVRDISNS